MSTGTSNSEPFAIRAAHWAGCIVGTALILLFVVFALGLGVPPLGEMNAGFIALALMLTGFALMWWHDLAGAVLSLLGIGLFYGLEFVANGHAPGGWVFPLCFAPGVLGVIAWIVRHFSASRAAT